MTIHAGPVEALRVGGGSRTGAARAAILLVVVLASAAAFRSTAPAETAEVLLRMEHPLATLLRFMAAVKAAMALATLGAILWRLQLPVTLPRLALLSAAAAAMATGPVLIWDLVHVGLGALLLHAGLGVALVALWRDPDLATHVSGLVAARSRSFQSLSAGSCFRAGVCRQQHDTR